MPGKTPSERKQARDARRAARQKKQKTTTPYAKKGYLKKTGGEGTFDYTQSKKDIKKKYKTDKKTKSKVLNSNVLDFFKNRTGIGMFLNARVAGPGSPRQTYSTYEPKFKK